MQLTALSEKNVIRKWNLHIHWAFAIYQYYLMQNGQLNSVRQIVKCEVISILHDLFGRVWIILLDLKVVPKNLELFSITSKSLSVWTLSQLFRIGPKNSTYSNNPKLKNWKNFWSTFEPFRGISGVVNERISYGYRNTSLINYQCHYAVLQDNFGWIIHACSA